MFQASVASVATVYCSSSTSTFQRVPVVLLGDSQQAPALKDTCYHGEELPDVPVALSPCLPRSSNNIRANACFVLGTTPLSTRQRPLASSRQRSNNINDQVRQDNAKGHLL